MFRTARLHDGFSDTKACIDAGLRLVALGAGRWFPSLCSDFLLHQEPLPAAPATVEAISGACMLVKREALARIIHDW